MKTSITLIDKETKQNNIKMAHEIQDYFCSDENIMIWVRLKAYEMTKENESGWGFVFLISFMGILLSKMSFRYCENLMVALMIFALFTINLLISVVKALLIFTREYKLRRKAKYNDEEITIYELYNEDPYEKMVVAATVNGHQINLIKADSQRNHKYYRQIASDWRIVDEKTNRKRYSGEVSKISYDHRVIYLK